MGLLSFLFKRQKRKRNEWESIGRVNNATENLSVKVDKRIVRKLVEIVEDSYGTQIGYVTGRTFIYKSKAVGFEWSKLEQGHHGSDKTQIEIFRKLKRRRSR